MRRTLLAAAALVLGACSAIDLRTPEPAITRYLLDAAVHVPVSDAPGSGVLLVEMPTARSGFDTPRLAYSRKPLAIDYYTRSEWADTPARQLQPLLVRALEASAAWRAVTAAPSPVLADQRLGVDILELVQDFTVTPSVVRLRLRLTLSEVASRRALVTRTLATVEPADSEDAYGSVEASKRALSRLLSGLVADVMTYAPTAGARR